MAQNFIGVDVGTGSARAGVFDASGKLLGSAKRDITMWREPGEIAEQSSENIWQAICASVRQAMAEAGVDASSVGGLGFDATCSLVVLDQDGAPLSVGNGGPERNIIVWMDHRATEQAERINAGGYGVLDYVGGKISPEMETPKLLWLKENRPEIWAKAWQFFDLADYLGWRATGSLARSTCPVTCKWTYLAHENRWDDSYFRAIGLGDLVDEGFARIGTEIVPPGTKLGAGLTEAAAADLGLVAGTPVGAGMIDAHAGGIGSVGASGGQGKITSRMAYVFGTSACTMSSTEEAAFVPGVWGPYFSAMVPGLWLNEGGQSLAGAAIDALVQFHPAKAEAEAKAAAEGVSLLEWLSRQALAGAADASSCVDLAAGLHVVPDLLGNRSPHADPNARGMISGLGIETGIASLVGLYIAAICSLGYGLRQIADAQRAKGVETECIVISGGAGQNPLVRQLMADSSGIAVALPQTPEPVLLGAAMLGAVAGGAAPDLASAMGQMSALAGTLAPNAARADLHSRRYKAFGLLQDAERQTRALF